MLYLDCFVLFCNSAFRSILYSFHTMTNLIHAEAAHEERGKTMRFQRIQDLRTDSDLSQKQLGEILYISQRTYSYYETGAHSIPIEILIRLANYYDVSIDYLVGRTSIKKTAR